LTWTGDWMFISSSKAKKEDTNLSANDIIIYLIQS